MLGVSLVLSSPRARSQNKPETSYWMEQGATAMQKGKAQAAEEDFSHAITIAPRSADAYLGLGMAQLRGGKLKEAQSSLARASELNPVLLNAHLFRGIALLQENVLEPAIRELQEENQLQPRSAEVLTWLGIIELQAGRPSAAASTFDQALGLALAKLGQNEEAVGWLERVLTNSPSDFILQSDYYELVKVYQKLNRKADSHNALEELRRLKSQNPASESVMESSWQLSSGDRISL